MSWSPHLDQRRSARALGSGQATSKGKGGKFRTVPPLNAAVRAAMAVIRPQGEQMTGPIFRGKRGPYTDRGVRNLLAALGRRAEVANVYPLRFRHDAARRLVEQVALPTVAALLQVSATSARKDPLSVTSTAVVQVPITVYPEYSRGTCRRRPEPGGQACSQRLGAFV